MSGSPDSLEQRTQTFYSLIRDWIVSVVFFVALFAVSHALLTGLQRRRRRRADEEYESVERASLPFFFCTLALTFGLAAVLLVPATTWATVVLLRFPESYYTQWLSMDLVAGAWRGVYFGSYLSLFVFVPFSYFYHESEAVGSVRSVGGRVGEASAIVVLLSVLLVGLVSVVRAALWAGPAGLSWMLLIVQSPSEVKESALETLTVLPQVVATVGIIAGLAFAPKGVADLLLLAFGLRVPLVLRSRAEERVFAMRLEEESILREMEGTTAVQRTHSQGERQTSVPELDIARSSGALTEASFGLRRLRVASTGSSDRDHSGTLDATAALELAVAHRKQAERELRLPRIRRNFFMVVGLAINGFLLWHVLIRYVGGAVEGNEKGERSPEADPSLSGAFLEACLEVYIGVAVFVGIYSSRVWLSSSVVGPVTEMVANTVLTLVVGLSLPAVVDATGLSSSGLFGPLADRNPLGHSGVRRAYSVLFVVILGCFVYWRGRHLRWSGEGSWSRRQTPALRGDR